METSGIGIPPLHDSLLFPPLAPCDYLKFCSELFVYFDNMLPRSLTSVTGLITSNALFLINEQSGFVIGCEFIIISSLEE